MRPRRACPRGRIWPDNHEENGLIGGGHLTVVGSFWEQIDATPALDVGQERPAHLVQTAIIHFSIHSTSSSSFFSRDLTFWRTRKTPDL
jgi:hypothetical protein